MNINVKEEDNASYECVQNSHNDKNCETKTEDVDVVEQFIDETGIHDRNTWIFKHEYVKKIKSSQKINENGFHSTARTTKNQTYAQIRHNHRKKANHIIDWQLLIRAVMERPLLWNKILDVYKNKIVKAATYREACQVLMKDFEEMAQEDQEIIDEPKSDESDLTEFGKDEWGTYFYLKNPFLKEDLTLKSNSIKLTTENGKNHVGKIERNSTAYQPILSTQTSFSSYDDMNDSYIKKYHRRTRLERNFCYYCEILVSNFARHMERSHSDEVEVQVILSKPKKSKIRNDLLTRLRKKGNYLKSLEDPTPLKIPHCPHCLGFYSRRRLYRHKQKCNENPGLKINISDTSGAFDKTSDTHLEIRKKVFPKMRPDKISVVAQQDILICEFGTRYLNLHRNQQREYNVTSQKMRQLSRLLIELKKSESTVTTLMDIFHPKYYDVIVKATKQIAQFDDQTKRCKSPNFARLIGISLKQCCEIAIDFAEQGRHIYSIMNVSDAVSSIRIFSTLLGGWKDDLYLESYNMLNSNEKLLNETKIDKSLQEMKIDPESYLNFHLKVDGEDYPCKNEENTVQQVLTKTNIFENDVKIIKKYETPHSVNIGKRKKIGKGIAWTNEQKKIVIAFFKAHIEMRKPPKKVECEQLKAENEELLCNKDWLKIKVFIQNIYTNKYKECVL